MTPIGAGMVAGVVLAAVAVVVLGFFDSLKDGEL
jgi:hypothetical protein